MTGPSGDDTASGQAGWRLYQSGPWLVIYGRGPESEDAGRRAHDQCVARRIDSRLRPIDEIAQVRLDRFTGLIVVLPTQLDAGQLASLQPFTSLIMDYRARRPEGLDSLLTGHCEWFDAGVLQVVGQRAIIRELGRATLDRVCARHYTDDSAPVDVFHPYTARSSGPAGQPAGEVLDEDIARLWRDVQAWGITDIHTVPKLRRCIDEFRSYYENERFTQLYRPIKDLNRNRLDIILDGPHDVVIGTAKTWMENGASVSGCHERA